MKNILSIAVLSTAVLLSGCVSYQTKETNYKLDACKMLTDNYDWYQELEGSYKKWGVPISIQLAFVKQESNFSHEARPYKVVNGKRKLASSALGYSQALNGTWEEYRKDMNKWNADRTDFGDAIDFMGWYNDKSMSELNLQRVDAYNLYLAYHEGRAGWKKKTYNKKGWLLETAKKVEKQAYTYSKQLNNCSTIGY